MNHWIIVPVILPALAAPVLGFVMRHDIRLARVFSAAATAVLAAVALGLFLYAAGAGEEVYFLGNWPAPFGIVLVLDQLSALMLLLTAVLALFVLWHAIATGWDARGAHFHALFQFQLMGICGAFLTGDLFNLFVFFEVLLIASYGLMVHSGGRMRMKAGLQYVVINLAGSTLFLFALGTLYATTGTLNMADLSVRVMEIPAGESALIRTAAMLLLVVFAVKAALVPVQFWLPGTYANAPAPVAALFAIMTKVGAYCILRVHTVVFGPTAPAIEGMVSQWLFWGAVLTLALGAIGVLGARRLMPLLAYAVIGSMGTVMMAVAAFSPEAASAALYYLVHSTFAAAVLFLVADLVTARRAHDGLSAQPPVPHNGLYAALFFGGAIAMAGMPPLSGFLGKLLVMDALRDPAFFVAGWTAILLGSLVTIVGFARAGSVVFWKATAVAPTEASARDDATAEHPPAAATPAELAPTIGLLLVLGALAIFAGPLSHYTTGAAAQLFDPADYIDAVLARAQEG